MDSAKDQGRVALVRLSSTWDFSVKHLEMDPLWLRSSYVKAAVCHLPWGWDAVMPWEVLLGGAGGTGEVEWLLGVAPAHLPCQALFEMERHIHAPLSTLEEREPSWMKPKALAQQSFVTWFCQIWLRMDVIWLNLQRNPHIENDDYLNEVRAVDVSRGAASSAAEASAADGAGRATRPPWTALL
eukprot:Skav214470  [mRNA]  locus=scaffold1167:132457:134032:+ [translate_table: standard]